MPEIGWRKRMRGIDPVTYQPIDAHGEAQRAEEERIARDLREQQRAYQEKLNERAAAEAFVRR
jgi:hypothetical protein